MKNGGHIFRRKRKGIVDIQFNWIFVMIAGFTIFLFIISIAFSQKNSADKRADTLAVNQVVTLLKDKQQTAEVYSEITFPKTEVRFRCDSNTFGDTEGYFTIQISNSQPTPMSNEIIFAPQELSTTKLIVWTKAFTVGFPVGVFIYVTTTDSAIIVYNNSPSSFASQLFSGLPDNITKNITTDLNFYSGYKNVKIICFDDGTNADCPSGYDYLMITPGDSPASKLFDYGNVTYHKKSGSESRLPYVTEAGLYGAIFSDSARYYDCQTSRAMKQLEIKRSLAESRVLMIQDNLELGNCRDIINVTLENDIIPMRNPLLDYDVAKMLGRTSRNLDIQNDKLIIGSCPKIY